MRHVPPDFYFFSRKIRSFLFCNFFLFWRIVCGFENEMMMEVFLYYNIFRAESSLFILRKLTGPSSLKRLVFIHARHFIFWSFELTTTTTGGRVQKIKLTIKKGGEGEEEKYKISLACGRQRDTQDTHFLLVMITTRQEVGRRVSCRVTRCHPFPPPSSSCCLFFFSYYHIFQSEEEKIHPIQMLFFGGKCERSAQWRQSRKRREGGSI